MKTTSEAIVFFGNERLATGVKTTAPTLRALIKEGYNVAAVVSNYEQGISRSARELEIAKVAEEHNIPVLLPNKPMDIKDVLESYGAVAAVLVAYGRIVPEAIINIFPCGIINIHPSLLPRHRGPTPIESAILNNDIKTGVSIMSLSKAMDAGPVYGQSEVPLHNESKQELADKLLDIGSSMLVELLPGIIDGSVVALPQAESQASYDELINKEDGILDWNKPADQLEREIRAFIGWPQSRTNLGSKDIVITKASVAPDIPRAQPGHISIVDKHSLLIQTAQGSLSIERLKPAGKREMTVKEFLAGYKL